MKRRHLQQVDTFPFLAVLLCAMGSLILVLLVMDRRSRLVARARQQQQYNQVQLAHAQVVSARQQENERRQKAVKSAWQKKRDALTQRLDQEEQQLDKTAQEVQAQLAEAARRLRQEEKTVQTLREQAKSEHTQLTHQQQQLRAAQEQAAGLSAQLSEAERVRAQLAADLRTLEKTLAELREARQQQAQTYSVIPYRGKQGDDRQPIYLECTSEAVIFHPEKKAAAGEAVLRSELTDRLKAQKEERTRAGLPAAAGYLLVLVRPEGIRRYYEVQALAREMQVDLGYEFVEGDWKLQFPAQDKLLAQPAPVSATPTHLPSPASATARRERPEGSGTSAVDRSGGSDRNQAVGLSKPLPLGSGSLSETLSATPKEPVRIPGPGTDSSVPLPVLDPSGPGSGPELPTPTLTRQDKSATEPISTLSPILPPSIPSTQPDQPRDRSRSSPIASGSRSGTSRPRGPQVDSPIPERRQPMLRPALVSGAGVLTIFVECRPDQIIVHPSAQPVPLEGLGQVPMYNPLYQTVQQLISRRRAAATPGSGPLRVQIRFLVHREAERVYHQAYPALHSIPDPKTSYLLQPGDSVDQILASD